MRTTTEQQPRINQFLALAEVQDLNVFEYEEQFYIGATQYEFDELETSLCECESVSRDDIDNEIKQWIDENNYTLLEDEFEVSSYDDNIIEYAGGEYLVVDEATADQLWDESLDSYLEECVYPELPDNIRNYFDYEKWKSGARMDGRGHALSSYDGNEDNARVNDEDFFIFRVN